MEALLTSFIAAALGQWGDKSQWQVSSLAGRYRRPGPVLAGVAIAAAANALIAGFAGRLVHDTITPRAIGLLLALAFAFAAAEGLIGRRPKPIGEGSRFGAFPTAAFCQFLLGFGDKSQFITFGIAAYYDAPWLAAGGAAAGIVAASLPAALLGERFGRAIPVKPIRIGVGLLFLALAFVLAVNALRLT